MKKKDIIKKNYEFTEIINNCKHVSNRGYVIYYEKSDYLKFGISVPKKTGIAVVRNKIKRQVKSIIDNNKKAIQSGYLYVIIIRKGLLDLNYREREKELINLRIEIGKYTNLDITIKIWSVR